MEERKTPQYPPPTSGGTPPPLGPPRQPQKSSNTNLKIVTGLLFVALLVALGFLYKVWNQTQELTSEKEQVVSEKEKVASEKEEVTRELESLRSDYSNLSTSNDTLNTRLEEEKKKIGILLERIKKTDASNKAKMKEYDKEIKSLRGLLKDYVKQIDDLSAKNKALQAEYDKVKQDADKNKKEATKLAQQAGSLQSMVDKGSAIKARDIAVTAINSKDKVVSKARQVEQIRVCLTLIENSIAKPGKRTIYLRVKSPDGSLLTSSPGNLFDPSNGGPQLIYSEKREIDFNGQDLEVCLFFSDSDGYSTGAYTVEIYLDGASIGSAQLTLK